ncbi:ethylene receptor family protein [Salix suchowensis]|nr:ethylene receptor family protein [Salix suchowensis]
MEGDPPSFMEDDVNQLDFETLMSELPSYVILKHMLSEDDCLQFSFSTEVPVNQSSITFNDQAGQNMLVDNNDSIQQTTRFPPSFPQTMQGHVHMTPNTTTSQHGGFNQPRPSLPAPRYPIFHV